MRDDFLSPQFADKVHRSKGIQSTKLKSEIFLIALRQYAVGTIVFAILTLLCQTGYYPLIVHGCMAVFLAVMYLFYWKYQGLEDRKIQIGVLGLAVPVIVVPCFFLFCGGLRSGALLLYILCAFLIVLLFNNAFMIVGLLLCVLSFLLVSFLGYRFPNLTTHFTDLGNYQYIFIPAVVIFVAFTIGAVFRLLYRNYMENKRMADELLQQLEQTSVRDPLSGAYDRRFLSEHIRKYISEVSENKLDTFSIIMFDIDRFKSINDRFGHLVGDECIRSLTKLVRGSLRKDDIIARYGGEEFICVLRGASGSAACRRAEEIRMAVEQAHLVKEFPEPITISCGISMFEPGMTGDQLVRLADKNLYIAKQRGRNKVVWE